MREGNSPLVRREDYTAPAYWIRSVDLSFDLDPAKTLVINRMRIERNMNLAGQPQQPLRLHGEELNLSRVLANVKRPFISSMGMVSHGESLSSSFQT